LRQGFLDIWQYYIPPVQVKRDAGVDIGNQGWTSLARRWSEICQDCNLKYKDRIWVVCLCVCQLAIATFTHADVASTWNCTNCPEVRVVPCVSGVDTIPKDGTVSTASRASTETAPGTRHIARCAEVRRRDATL